LSFFDDNGDALSLPLTFLQSGMTMIDSTFNRPIAAGATLVILTQGNAAVAAQTVAVTAPHPRDS
jgi:hypothetical protein